MNDTDTQGPRERAYDEQIKPLMDEIIARARGAGIPFLASFALDQDHPRGPLYCTTAIDPGDMPTKLRAAFRVIYY